MKMRALEAYCGVARTVTNVATASAATMQPTITVQRRRRIRR